MHTPGSMIKNKILHLESAKIKLSEFLKIKKKAQTGRLTARVAIIPAETALFSPLRLLAVPWMDFQVSSQSLTLARILLALQFLCSAEKLR